ncbi:cytochrome b561 domain-containing protein 2 isoform X2 [Carcharodon carcharias]|uniref:cytochrome b561 domain-containing protein 2 isoform X2 n=1 Tax=Carcharodon carcharias TaxID=13397 RepID=UPI001B7EDD90|nr:cytochrome b561 domain-containing protein 2 isoform X2 [Carcharodon carcharias]
MAEPGEDYWLYGALRKAAGTGAHLLSLGFPIGMAVVSKPGSSLFSWHPFLMALAFSFIMTQALLLFSPETSLIMSYSRKIKVRAHWLLQGLASTCAILGLAIISFNKYLNDKPHFTSWHGLVGLVTVLYICMQSIGGVSLLYPKLMNWSLSKLKLYHATSGLVGYLLGCTSLLLGMCSTWFTETVTGITWYLAVCCPVLLALVIMNQISNAYLKKKRMQP